MRLGYVHGYMNLALHTKHKGRQSPVVSGSLLFLNFHLACLLMFIFLLSFLSFILLSKSLSIKLLVPWAIELRFLSLCFWKQLSSSCLLVLKRSNTMSTALLDQKSFKKRALAYKLVHDDDVNQSILDLPELALECIFDMLPPSALCNMAAVCTSLRQRCTSDHLWEKHMKMKWGRVIHHDAYRQWQCQIACTNHFNFNFDQNIPKPLLKSLSLIWPLSWITLNHHHNSNKLQTCSPPHNSLMSWYLALDAGKFWFPAQVYNREHGHAGFMLSCYDAELCYNRCTDTFQARYPPHGRRTIVIEEGVQWDRLRAQPIDTPPHDLHISDCLNDLHPGDHIEIQWRRSKEFPYGWWYGIVGHLESCDGNENHCCCHNSDTVILEFNQYAPGSRWRRTVINRKDHCEEGNEADGFYGGIRKLHKMEEITMWKRLWPMESLE